MFWTCFVTPSLGSQCGILPMVKVMCKLSYAMPLTMPLTPNPLAGSKFYYAVGQMPLSSQLEILLVEVTKPRSHANATNDAINAKPIGRTQNLLCYGSNATNVSIGNRIGRDQMPLTNCKKTKNNEKICFLL